MPTETTVQPTSLRLTVAERAIIARLATVWGPTVPLSRQQVISELLRRAEAEILSGNGKQKKTSKKTGDDT